jgi:DnaK suppressor protein
MSTNDASAVRRHQRLAKMLEQKRSEILRSLERELGERLSEDALTAQDEKIEIGDRSVAVLGQDIELGVLELRRAELRRIDDALAHLEDGSYGICQDCGADIGEERLRIVPLAIRCVDCERRHELESKRIESTGRGFRAEFRDVREEEPDGEGEE